jgi:hypothetical protein
MKDAQSQDELKLFGRFLLTQGLPNDSRFFSKRPEPEPDILFNHPSEGPIAFEVVEIIDEAWARVRGSTPTLTASLRSSFEALPQPTKSALVQLYRDADIGFHFKPGVSRNKRVNRLPAIFSELGKLSPGTHGPALDEHRSCADVLFNVYIHRAPAMPGPHFHTSDVTSVGDATVDTIQGKVEKAATYQTVVPIELLAYTDANAAEMPEDVWQANLAAYFASGPSIRFRRIWVFNIRTDTAHLVFQR